MIATEGEFVSAVAFMLFWAMLNFLLVMVAARRWRRRCRWSFIAALILLSQLKHDMLFMTVNFVDLMVIDGDTFSFLMQIFPRLGVKVLVIAALVAAGLVLLWRFDPFRVRRRTALMGALACFAALVALALAVPSDPWDEFYAENYVSKFARSGVTAVGDLMTRGMLDSDATTPDRLASAAGTTCTVSKPPHIIMVFDESSFDIRAVPGVKVPAGYGEHFKSFDGKQRSLIVEGAGGPSWFTEYNVLTGLSARSYGRFADFVTRIAAGRVERGLPQALAEMRLQDLHALSDVGAFLSARNFQQTRRHPELPQFGSAGCEWPRSRRVLFQQGGGHDRESSAARIRCSCWSTRRRTTSRGTSASVPIWRRNGSDLGNRPEVDEYLRRQHMSARRLSGFRGAAEARLPRRDVPDRALRRSSAVLRAQHDRSRAGRHMLARRIAAADPRFLMTYYAINTINFTPRDVSSAVDALDAPYLPLVVLEAAGVPLDASFAEQKRILQRCNGLFYRCQGGAEARRFNRLLIDAGLIKGL